jgi:Family of unknown function (DUF5906)
MSHDDDDDKVSYNKDKPIFPERDQQRNTDEDDDEAKEKIPQTEADIISWPDRDQPRKSDDDIDEDEIHEKDLITGDKILSFPERPSQKKPADEIPIHSRKDAVLWVDNHYAATKLSGKFMIIDETSKDEYGLMSKRDFIDSLENIRIRITDENGDTKVTPISKLWLEYPDRRTYEKGIIFDPRWKFDSQLMRSGAYNTWPGFAIKPVKGDCPLFLAFVKEIICMNNPAHYVYLMSWLAQIFQEPWNKLGVALVLKGIKGVGKSYLIKIISMLMDGRSDEQRKRNLALTVDNKQSIFGPHNDHLENKLLLCLEEAIWAGAKAHESTLKHLITGDSLFINPKNLPGRMVRNHIRPVLISNADWIVPATYDERRFYDLNVSREHKDDKPYFDALDDELLKKGGLEALMYELMNWKIPPEVNLRTGLITDAQIDQKLHSMDHNERWWYDKLRSGQIDFLVEDSKKEAGWIVVRRNVLHHDYIKSMKTIGIRAKLLSENDLGTFLRAMVPKREDDGKGKVVLNKKNQSEGLIGTKRLTLEVPVGKTTEIKRAWAHIIPPLAVCRKLMELRLRGDLDWDEPNEWEQLEDAPI